MLERRTALSLFVLRPRVSQLRELSQRVLHETSPPKESLNQIDIQAVSLFLQGYRAQILSEHMVRAVTQHNISTELIPIVCIIESTGGNNPRAVTSWHGLPYGYKDEYGNPDRVPEPYEVARLLSSYRAGSDLERLKVYNSGSGYSNNHWNSRDYPNHYDHLKEQFHRIRNELIQQQQVAGKTDESQEISYEESLEAV